jgi:hypothetical protein
MAPAKRTAIVPQAPVHRVDVGTINDSDSATMATAAILPHLTLPAIGCKLATIPGSPFAVGSSADFVATF